MNNTRNTLLEWVTTGDLNLDNLEQALKLCHTRPKKQQWFNYLSTGLLWAAILLSTLGVIFFFAFNWQDMGRFTKFGLIEFIMLLCVALLLKAFLSQTLFSASLITLSLFTGALLALVGQTYQTGADPWQLFATWSAFILPWTLLAKSEALWSLWIVLLNLALYFYLDIHDGLFGFFNHNQINALAFSGLNTLLLAIAELYYYQQIKQQSPSRHIQQLLALFAGSAVTFLTITTIFYTSFNPLNFAYYLLWLSIAYVIYRHKHPDLFILSAATLSVIIVVISWLIEIIGNSLDNGGFIIITIAIISLSTLAAKWLKGIAKQWEKQSS